jgi:hypothetical protein
LFTNETAPKVQEQTFNELTNSGKNKGTGARPSVLAETSMGNLNRCLQGVNARRPGSDDIGMTPLFCFLEWMFARSYSSGKKAAFERNSDKSDGGNT